MFELLGAFWRFDKRRGVIAGGVAGLLLVLPLLIGVAGTIVAYYVEAGGRFRDVVAAALVVFVTAGIAGLLARRRPWRTLPARWLAEEEEPLRASPSPPEPPDVVLDHPGAQVAYTPLSEGNRALANVDAGLRNPQGGTTAIRDVRTGPRTRDGQHDHEFTTVRAPLLCWEGVSRRA